MRIFLKGKIVSDSPTKVLDVFRKKYTQFQIEESRRDMTDIYSLWTVLVKGSIATKITKHFEEYKNLTMFLQGDAYCYNGAIPLVYASEVIVVSDRTGSVCH